MNNIDYLKNNGVNIEESIKLLGDIKIYNETLKDFIDESKNKISQLKKYKENSDMLNYAIIVHSLKSDSKYLGFTKLAELALNHETNSKENNLKYINSNYNELMKEINKAINVSKTYIEGETNSINNQLIESSKSILIADDSDIIRKIIQRIFSKEYNVFMASNGQEAIDILSYNRENIIGILLDLNMPEISGFQVLDFLKANDLFTKIPVAIITGDDSKESIDKSFDYPILDILNKPFNEESIKNIVNRMINIK